MTLVDPPYILEEGLIGQAPIAKVGGTGSISTLAIPEDEAAAAEKRRGPLGFRARDLRVSPDTSFLAPALEAAQQLVAEKVERELRDLGECLWTARDTIVIYDGLAGQVVGYP